MLITSFTNATGDVINVPVYINRNGMYNNASFDVNKVATVFGRENIRKYINNEVQKGTLVRIKRKSTQSRAAASPIKAGDRLNASTNNYTQNGGNVNSDSEESSRDLSEVSRTQFYELIKENREILAYTSDAISV